jgi:hemerythrin-like domain-containing protein
MSDAATTDQASHAAQGLGTKLAPLLGGGFFRPLTRPTAAIYIDCAANLCEAADEGGQIEHAEARQLIREVLAAHPDVQLDEDEGGKFRDLNQRAAQFFNKLIEANWLTPRRVSLDENFVLITPPLRRLLRLLRDLAEDRPAELKDFAATLRTLCRDLLADGALDPNRLNPEEMRQTVKDLLERGGRAEDQMHAVETLILRQETAQRQSATPNETIQRMMVDFHQGEHMVCYDALQEAGLLSRLNQAHSVALEAFYDPFTKQRLAEGLAKHFNLNDAEAFAEAERWLNKLCRQLASIPAKQRIIDGRMSDFARLSAARYRYQTEMRGRQPEQVKAYLDEAARIHGGRSFASLADEPGMTFLTPTVEVFWGTDSLSRPRRQRLPVDLNLAPPPENLDADAAKDEIRRRNLDVLTPQRAARFIEKQMDAKGARISTEQLHLVVEDDLLDLLAVLAFDRGPAAAGSHRLVRWRVHPLRADFGTEPERIPRDAEADRLFERFTIERIS